MPKKNPIIQSYKLYSIPEEVEELPKISYHITKATSQGIFNESVSVCDEDRDIMNDMVGYQFAERKCDIKYHSVLAKNLEQRYIEARHIYILAKEKFPENEEILNFLLRQLRLAHRDYQDELKIYRVLRDNYKSWTETSLKLRREVLEKHKEN